MIIVAFGHKKSVGKDTARKFLSSHLRATGYKGNIQKDSFASGLKRQAKDLFGWAGLEDENYYNKHRSLRELPLDLVYKSPRQIWIEYGNKVRDIYEDVWVDYLLSQHKNTDVLLIADLRYPNEAERIHKYGGLCIKIENSNIEPTDDVADCALDGYTEWDSIIDNSGSLNDLHALMVEFANGKFV